MLGERVHVQIQYFSGDTCSEFVSYITNSYFTGIQIKCYPIFKYSHRKCINQNLTKNMALKLFPIHSRILYNKTIIN